MDNLDIDVTGIFQRSAYLSHRNRGLWGGARDSNEAVLFRTGYIFWGV